MNVVVTLDGDFFIETNSVYEENEITSVLEFMLANFMSNHHDELHMCHLGVRSLEQNITKISKIKN